MGKLAFHLNVMKILMRLRYWEVNILNIKEVCTCLP